jgi:hypothetical protein
MRLKNIPWIRKNIKEGEVIKEHGRENERKLKM